MSEPMIHPRGDIAADLYNRAVAAMYRTDPIPQQPAAALSGVEEHDGRTYVVLRNGNGLVACYRVRNDHKLKRLVRLPSGIEDAS